jgi:hypothetical protein
MAKGSSKANSRHWVSLVPFGLNQQHPNNYKDILNSFWENRDSLGYAWRILNDGCCDGCALGTTGMRDWTMKGIHLCAVRSQLLRLNTKVKVEIRLFQLPRNKQTGGQPLGSRANCRSRCYDFFQHA